MINQLSYLHKPNTYRVSLWPERSFLEVTSGLAQNLRIGNKFTATYNFRVKTDISGAYQRIEITPNGELKATTTSSDTINKAFNVWQTRHQDALFALVKRLLGTGMTYNIYGKMGSVSGSNYFFVYFVTVGEVTIYGDDALSSLLYGEGGEGYKHGVWYIVPPTQEISLIVDVSATSHRARCIPLERLKAHTMVVAFPTVDDSDEKTPTGLLRSLGFSYKKEPETGQLGDETPLFEDPQKFIPDEL